jgi:hypothetical protein
MSSPADADARLRQFLERGLAAQAAVDAFDTVALVRRALLLLETAKRCGETGSPDLHEYVGRAALELRAALHALGHDS